MKRSLLVLAALTVAFAGAASAKKNRIDYAAYAGEPVKEIRYFQLYNWQRSTDRQLVLWTKPSTAYVLELAYDCDVLRGARATIEVGGVAAIAGRLQVNDDIIVGPMKCKVSAIRPIDLEAVKQAKKA